MEDEKFPKPHGSGSGTENGYSVEARYNSQQPKAFGKYVFDNRWRNVEFDRAEIGVPRGMRLWHHAERAGLLSYPAAQAMRWWLHAYAEAEVIGGSLCLETRIIKHQIKFSHEQNQISAHDHVHGEDRSNVMPGWKK